MTTQSSPSAGLRGRLRAEWFGNIRGDLLSGLVVALALIPEAIAFSIIAGVDPKVGLYASFSIAVVTPLLSSHRMVRCAHSCIQPCLRPDARPLVHLEQCTVPSSHVVFTLLILPRSAAHRSEGDMPQLA